MEKSERHAQTGLSASSLLGGICCIRNTENGRYYLTRELNPEGSKNRFSFYMMTGECPHFKLKGDWEKYGSSAFV